MNPAGHQGINVVKPYLFAQSMHAYSAVSDIYKLLEKNRSKDLVMQSDISLMLLAEAELLSAIKEFSIDAD